MEVISELIQKIEKMTVLELSELVKQLEERFGVSSAQMAFAPAAAAPAAASAEAETASAVVNVVLENSGSQKVAVIKVLREVLPHLSLKEAKDLVDTAPQTIKQGINREEANELKAKLETAGAKAQIK